MHTLHPATAITELVPRRRSMMCEVISRLGRQPETATRAPTHPEGSPLRKMLKVFAFGDFGSRLSSTPMVVSSCAAHALQTHENRKNKILRHCHCDTNNEAKDGRKSTHEHNGKPSGKAQKGVNQEAQAPMDLARK